MTSAHNKSLWENSSSEVIAARVAIAGDFLPSGNLQFPRDASWREMAPPLAAYFADISASFVNLESPLSVEGLHARPLNGLGQIVASPSGSLDYLQAIRAHAISLANNHAYDFGDAGVERTRSAISQSGMILSGAGQTLQDHPEFCIWQGPGEIRVGFWAAAKATHDPATRKSPGVEPATIARAAEAIRALRNQGARFCIALVHAGCLRTNRPAPEDVALLDSLALSGFDIVAASHSHRISGARQIEGQQGARHFCFYGLGSIVSGYIASPLEREGLIVVAGLNLRGDLVRLEARPVHIAESGFGEIPSPEISRVILDRFDGLSAEISDGSFKRLFYQDTSPGLLQLYARDARAAFRQSGIRGLARKASRLRIRHVRRLVRKVTG
jgi:poly-gamma-glutamate capsule biosynthesis protein CapA/YwtB (metallophosphatase superfamily)